MKVLYVGASGGQSSLMQKAMQRRGHQVFAVDPYAVLGTSRLLTSWTWHTGAAGTAGWATQFIKAQVGGQQFDVAFVDNGEMISAEAVQFLATRAGKVALFNRDNPFVPRDGRRWRHLLQALPFYDLFVTPRTSTAERAPGFGARAVLRVNFFADEELHQPVPVSGEELKLYGSPVSFVGTWFPERGPFIETLLRCGVPLKVVGAHWQKAANYVAFRHVHVPGYLRPSDYTAAVRCARIALCLLSKGNKDVQTSRSTEIPAMGVVLCAERTDEHQAMYREGEEAIFWTTAEECAAICLALLSDPERLERIAAAGRQRALTNDNWAEPTLDRILYAAAGLAL